MNRASINLIATTFRLVEKFFTIIGIGKQDNHWLTNTAPQQFRMRTKLDGFDKNKNEKTTKVVFKLQIL